MKPMQSARIASYPCRIEHGTPNWTISFRDLPQALAVGRGVPGVFEAAESVLVATLDSLGANSVGGLPAASAPAPGEIMVTVRRGGPPLVRTSAPEGTSSSGSDASEEDIPTVSGEVVDVSTETGLVATQRQGGFWSWLTGLFGGSRSF